MSRFARELMFRYFALVLGAAVCLALVMVTCLSLAPALAWATDDEGTPAEAQGQAAQTPQILWDPNDPSSWTADESPFYPEGIIDMTPEELLVLVKQIEDAQAGVESSNGGSSSGSSLSTQSVTLESTNKLITAGCKYYGLPFIMGGRYITQGGFDCTGFIIQCLDDAFGIKIDRAYTTAEDLYNKYCTPVSAENAKPGDLVFWRGTYGIDPNWISHVGIYCGDNIAFLANSTADRICFQDINQVRNIKGESASIVFGTVKTLDAGDVTNDYFETVTAEDGKQTTQERQLMWRFYNRSSGEHLYTLSKSEFKFLALIGWVYEGVCWEAPREGDEVYRLYNPNNGDHHYTPKASERDHLVSIGWVYESVCWLSNGTTPVYRLFNPNETVGTHHYTTSKEENDWLVSIGWVAEGVGWYTL